MWVGLAGVALLLYLLEGGFPPTVWILLWQSLRSFSHLWAMDHVSLLRTMAMLMLASLTWLVAWSLLFWVSLIVLRHHRGLYERQKRREAWQTTRRISELDPFALPGEHTLTLPMADCEDDEDKYEGGRSNTLRPPIRLPQHTQLSHYTQTTQKVRLGGQTAYVPVSSSTQQAQSAHGYVLEQTARFESPLVVAKEALPDMPTKPETQSSQVVSRSKVVRSIEAARAAKGQDSLQTAKMSTGVTNVAVEDIPTTPNPPTSSPSSQSRNRTVRLDTSAHTPVVLPSKPRADLTLEAGVGWHRGLTRQKQPNEDSVVTLRGMCTYREQLVPFGLFVVADGMGGHACGQEASRIAIRTLAQSVLGDIMQPESLDDKQLIELLARSVEQANAAIYQRGQEWDKDMGTTLTAALIVDTKTSIMAYIVNAGDSRTYLLGKGEPLQQITRDHSLVANLVAAGAITPDAVYTHPERNKVYRSLGNSANIDIDWFTRELRSGDTLLLCSDGLWEMVRDPDIERILRQNADPTSLCTQLIQAALEGGGADNVSAVVVRIAS